MSGGTNLVRGRLVLEDRIAPGRIAIEDGRIAALELDDAEAGGPLIAPGYVDLHVHGWGGHDAMGPDGALDGMAQALLRRGVTSFLPTAVTAPLPALRSFAERTRAWLAGPPGPPADGAAPLGFNIEGPFISPARAGAQDPASIVAPGEVDRAALEPLLDGLRYMTVAPETPGALALISWLRDRGVAVSVGHSAATAEEARAGYAAGAVTTTHLFNAMTGVDHHAPGVAVAALVEDGAYVELIADGHHVHPAVWPIIVRTKPADRLVLVSDAISLAGTGATRATLGAVEVEVVGERCTVVGGGQLAGSMIALDGAVRNLVGSGVALPVAVAAAGRNPLALLGVTDRGRIAVGQLAHLIELDDELGVRRVRRDGPWLPGAAG
jgi:N-acetylglucosamine-6-phosphate deacetylase